MIVLDTHAWVWWINDSPELSTGARDRIDAALADEAVRISSISAWEVTLLAARGRLQLALDVAEWIARTEALAAVRFVPVDNAIAVHSLLLPPPFHADPADRIIVATALQLGAPLVTRDRRIHEYAHVESIW